MIIATVAYDSGKVRRLLINLLSQVAERMTRMLQLSSSTEKLPSKENRVDLSPKVDPVLSIPQLRFTFAPDACCIGGLKAGVETVTALTLRTTQAIHRQLRGGLY